LIPSRTGWLALTLLVGLTWTAAAQTTLERPFTLIDTNGRAIGDKDLRGYWLLVFFGYTSCPDICPTTLSAMTTVLEQLGPLAARVRPVFITVDPARDRAEDLSAYVAAFDQRIVGLTGSEEQIARTAAVFGAQYFKVPGANPKEYSIAHSAVVYVVGPEGGLVTQFSNANDADAMARTLAVLLK
jgi:protein SCO1/2